MTTTTHYTAQYYSFGKYHTGNGTNPRLALEDLGEPIGISTTITVHGYSNNDSDSCIYTETYTHDRTDDDSWDDILSVA